MNCPPDSRGWATPKQARPYAAKASERTFRQWLKSGLRHSRLPNGSILVSYAAIDEFLQRYEVSENHIDAVVDEVVREVTDG
jgi:hypothetical protein